MHSRSSADTEASPLVQKTKKSSSIVMERGSATALFKASPTKADMLDSDSINVRNRQVKPSPDLLGMDVRASARRPKNTGV